MAYLKKKKRSPYYYISHRNESGARIEISTGLRWSIPSEARKAAALMHDYSAKELKTPEVNKTGNWDSWVPDYMLAQYGDRVRTLQTYQTRWKHLAAFMKQRRILHPQQLHREDTKVRYRAWRQGEDQPGKRKPSSNTVRMELKFLHSLLQEACERGYVDKNVASRLNIPKLPPAEKPEMTDYEIMACRNELSSGRWPEWMAICFEIALNSGVRLEETNVLLDDVLHGLDGQWTMTIRNAKGSGEAKTFTVPLRPELATLLARLKAERPPGSRAFDPKPDNASKWWKMSRAWHTFFKVSPHTLSLRHLCFHCLRVTFISRGARAQIPEALMLRLVNHSQTTVHRAYQRLTNSDLQIALGSIAMPRKENS